MLAVYSAGMSIESPAIGYFCSALILLGTIFSYSIRTLIGGSKLVKIDGLLYAVAATCSIVFAPTLITFMPDNGFPLTMAAAGGLCWMLVFGSFLSWRDGTLLFQAVPNIAIFGLVGCYDTYRNVVFAFFGFLICLCTCFARANGREMLRRAAESGYFDRAGIKFDPNEPEQSAELFDAVRRGPWRWVAGPEWALASALAIVAVSLLGAPVIQSSVQGVAGFAAIKMPTGKRHSNSASVTAGPDSSGSTGVGQGPITNMTGQPVFEAHLDHARYMRMHTYLDYNSSRWRSDTAGGTANALKLLDFAIDSIKEPKVFQFSVTPRQSTRSFALPGDVDVVSLSDSRVGVAPDGGYEGLIPLDSGQTLSGQAVESVKPNAGRSKLEKIPEVLEPYVEPTNVPPSVADFADRATAGLPDDRAKADALMAAIGKQAQYNANVAATPPGKDAVENFLFTEHQGYCDLFASSMVLAARSVGIPARYVTGYLPDETSSLSGLYVVRDTDYHAWAELFFKDVGWVIYDPTTVAQVAEGGELKINSKTESIGTATISRLIDLGIIVLVLGSVVLLVRSKWRPRDKTRERRTELEQTYVSFAKAIRAATGRRRLLSETPSEYLAATLPSLNGASELATSLTEKFDAALYSRSETTPETVTELRSDLKKLKKLLQDESGKKKGSVPEKVASP
jgi:transglutaminase-like putative cysteine protease